MCSYSAVSKIKQPEFMARPTSSISMSMSTVYPCRKLQRTSTCSLSSSARRLAHNLGMPICLGIIDHVNGFTSIEDKCSFMFEVCHVIKRINIVIIYHGLWGYQSSIVSEHQQRPKKIEVYVSYTFSTRPTPPFFSSNSSVSTALSVGPVSTPTLLSLNASNSFALNRLR